VNSYLLLDVYYTLMQYFTGQFFTSYGISVFNSFTRGKNVINYRISFLWSRPYVPICLTVYTLLCEGPSITAPPLSLAVLVDVKVLLGVFMKLVADLNHYYDDDESDYSVAILK
jgi:hypothetical protein